AALAGDLDLERVGGRHERAGFDADFAERQPEPEVRTDHHVDALQHADFHQFLRAAGEQLFGVLEDEAHFAAQLVAHSHQHGDGAEQLRRVAVVPAGVHHAGRLGDEVVAVLLVDRQRIDVGAHREHGARLAGDETRDHARLRRPRQLEPADLRERVVDPLRRPLFLERQLWILMQVAPPTDDGLSDRIDGRVRGNWDGGGHSLWSLYREAL